jgi:PAS domain S-box-containing protein
MNNPRASELLGLSDDQLRGKAAMDPAWKFVGENNHPLSLDQYPVNRIVDRKQPIKNQVLGIHQSNKEGIVWVTVNGFPMLNKSGEITEIVISFIDITERKQEEKARREADELFKHVFEYSNVGKSITSPNGEINVNKAFCNLLGYTKEELQNKKWQELTHPDDLELSLNEVNRIRSREVDQVRFNKRFFHKNGSVIWVDLNSSALLNNAGELQLITTIIDITDNKRSELLLKEKTEEIEAQNEELNQTNQKLAEAKEIAEKNEARMKMALRVSKSGAWDWDIQKNTFYWSDEFLQLFGLPENTIPGFEAWTKALHPDDIEIASLKILEAIENQMELVNDYRIILPNNEIRWIRATGNVIVVNNKPQRMIGLCMDMTTQKAEEQELFTAKERAEESEKLLAKIAENYPNSFVSVIEKDLTVGFSGGQEFKRQNLNPNDFVGLTLEQVFGGFTEIVKENYLTTFSGKETSFELFINNQYQLYKTVPLADEHNNITRILSVVENITEHKQSEKALKESEERFKNMFERHSSVMLLVEPETGLITGANEASARFYGYSIAELLTMRIDQINILSPEQVKMERKLALREERSYFVFPHRLANGEVRTVEVHSSPIVLKDRQILFSIIHDISERKHLEKIRGIQYNIATAVVTSNNIEQLLEFVRTELSQVFDTANFFAALYDPHSNKLKKLHWADEVDEFEEWDASKSFSGYVVKTGKSLLLNRQEIAKLGADQNIPIMGTPAECWLGVPLVVDKKTIGVLVIQSYTDSKAYDDSSARLFEQVAYDLSVFIEKTRILQDLNIAKLHAEESDRLKSAFLANMSHEIRTPMNGILGFAEILKDPDLTGEQQREYIKIIEKSGIRMLNIINDIIDISKIESGLMKLDLKESNINEQIEYIYTFFKPEAEAKGIKLSFKTTLTAKEAIVKTDREKVYAILTNLVKNAIKYTQSGAIEFGYDLVSSQLPMPPIIKLENTLFLQFYIKDTGIGIPANRQEAIFERFIQADITDKMARQGAGLGLAITKSYIEMLGGRIWVESQEDVGSTFYFTLPYNSKPVEKTIGKTSVFEQGTSNNRKTIKILIAEDDEISEILLSVMVGIFSNGIVKVHNGLEAVETIRKNPDIDLILMDIQMPVMGGYEAIRQIREFNEKVIIIAQTAYGLSGDREKAINAGCNDYIAKPINKAELQAMILKYFG